MTKFLLLAVTCIVAGQLSAQPARDHDVAVWISEALAQIQSVRVGMTRGELQTQFTTEGGLSTGLRRTYVFRRCTLIKVDVEFEPVARPARDADGRVTLVEADQDVIKGISKPYLGLSVQD
jgi:hypothetical protein